MSEGHEQVEETVVGTWELMSDRRQEGRCLKDKTRAAEHELAPVRSLEPGRLSSVGKASNKFLKIQTER